MEFQQQEGVDLAPIKARQKARSKIEHLHGSLCLTAVEGQQASNDCAELITEIERHRARIQVLETSVAPPSDLIARLTDYRAQVLNGFRHISRLDEAELIQAAIDGLRPPVAPVEGEHNRP